MNVLLTTLNAKYIHSSIALRYIREYGRTKGMDWHIEEYTINMPIYDILQRVTKTESQIVGFACYIWNIDMTLHLTKLIHRVSPETIIVLGGPEVSYCADEILRENPEIGFIVQGEGEEAFTALVESLEKGEVPDAIPGIRGQNEEGELFGSTEVVEVADLSTVPFPYSEEDLTDLEHRIIYYESSRGCPFSCQYCLSGNRNKVRFFPEERTRKELQWFMDHKVPQVKFVDRTYNCSPRHHLPMMEFLKNADTHTNFHLEMEGVLMTEKERDILMTAPEGRFQIEVGVQSTHEPTLTAVRRRNVWDHIQAMIVPIIEAGRTHVHMDLIIGLPHESYDIFKQSFTDLYALQPQALQLGFLKLLKGSGVRAMEEFQYVYDPQAPYEVLATHVMPYEKIRFLKVFEDVFETFYNGEKYRRTFHFLHEILEGMGEEKGVMPFTVYECMTEFWMARGHHLLQLKDKDRTIFLYEFWQHLGETIPYFAPYVAMLQDFVRIDTLYTFRGKLKDEAIDLPVQEKAALHESEAFWREEELVQAIIPGYSFKQWRHIRQRFYEMTIAQETATYLGLAGTRIIVDVEGEIAPFTRPALA